MLDNKGIGLAIYNARKKLQMSRAELGTMINLHESTVKRYEDGEIGKVGMDVIQEFAKALHVDVAYLFGIEPKQKNQALRINVYGSIPAGVPIEAIEDIQDWEEIPAEMAVGGKEFLALVVKGDSMWPKYLEGDIVIIQLQPDCESGEDCAIYVNGYDATLKKVKKSEGKITLQPINQNYAPKTYTHPGEVKILGKVVELRRKI